MKYCKNCIWFEQCGQDCACSEYEPASIGESEEALIDAYIADLTERHELYAEQLAEQNQ